MNYSLDDLPDSGKNPIIIMHLTLNGENFGKLQIRLFRDVFPAGVENFVGIASGKTYRVVTKGKGQYAFNRETRRTYDGCKIFKLYHNNYIVSGDIYNNTGANAGTIFNDQPIPADFGPYYYRHETIGLVSLIPYRGEDGELYYDSTFMITLDNAKPSNSLHNLDNDQIVIGQVYGGIDVLKKLNMLIKPFAGRSYPNFVINKCEVRNNKYVTRRRRPTDKNYIRKFVNRPQPKISNEPNQFYSDNDDTYGNSYSYPYDDSNDIYYDAEETDYPAERI
jgi:cyclophilin family peptidyl-prolyl cis-trans isomerase